MKAIATVGERLQLIKDWQCSGLTVSEWCRRNGIHKNTFCNWIHRSRKQGLLETPAVIPQPIDQDPIKQDIVKIEVSPEQPKYSMRFFSDDNASDMVSFRPKAVGLRGEISEPSSILQATQEKIQMTHNDFISNPLEFWMSLFPSATREKPCLLNPPDNRNTAPARAGAAAGSGWSGRGQVLVFADQKAFVLFRERTLLRFQGLLLYLYVIRLPSTRTRSPTSSLT